MRRVLRVGAVALLIAWPLAIALGYLVDGSAGVWGALIGMGLAVVFFALTVAVALGTAHMEVSALGAAVLGSWLIKMVLLIGVLVLLRDADFYSRPMLFATLLVGTIGALLLEAWVVNTTRVPYTETRPR
jgi:hypothetical protein